MKSRVIRFSFKAILWRSLHHTNLPIVVPFSSHSFLDLFNFPSTGWPSTASILHALSVSLRPDMQSLQKHSSGTEFPSPLRNVVFPRKLSKSSLGPSAWFSSSHFARHCSQAATFSRHSRILYWKKTYTRSWVIWSPQKY